MQPGADLQAGAGRHQQGFDDRRVCREVGPAGVDQGICAQTLLQWCVEPAAVPVPIDREGLALAERLQIARQK